VDEDTLAEQWVITGTWKKPFPAGPLAGVPPTGKAFSVPGASFLEWSDGKIQSSVHYYDQMALLTQIGVIPPPEQRANTSGN
jgi:predicted ester cyclase